MGRDEKLAQVLVEFAHTLGTDFPLDAILDRLVHRVVDVLPVTGAGVMLMNPDEDLHFIAASNDTIYEIETAQKKYEEGPCLEAYRTGQAVSIPDLGVDQRFPRFSAQAAAAGLAAVFTFPLRLDAHRLGALDLYRDTAGDLDPADQRAAQVLADVAAAYLFNAQARQSSADDLAQARRRSLHDPLTGLPNRALFAELLEHAVAGARRSHRTAAVIYIDLDRFKSVNDRFGHHVGDLLLTAVATRLGSALRPGDTLARLAGDEFVILCEDLADPRDAGVVAERISGALVEEFDVDGRRIAMTASVGVAFSGSGDEIPESLVRDADFAMYKAKGAGGAHHRVADRATRAVASRRARIEDDLPTALAGGGLTLAYQPICRSHDATLVAVEALLRWEHPDLGWVPPDVVIPIAERNGLVLSLGEWVLRRACSDFVRWRTSRHGVVGHLAVNISARQVMGPAFAATVAAVLADTAMDASGLHLEVTEGVFLDDAPRARAVLSEVKELGVRLSLDDFGTGYSALTYLKRFPFDALKIDRSFIADLDDDDPTSHTIVAAIIELSRALNLTTVAEGVETRRQLTRVTELGSDLAQGFYLGRPLPVATFEQQVLDTASGADPLRLPVGTRPEHR